MEGIESKARDAVARCLESKGYEVLDTDYSELHLVVYRGEVDGVQTVGLGTVSCGCGEWPEENIPDRGEWEKAAAEWLAFHVDKESRAVSPDAFRLNVIRNDQAIVSHHFNVFGIDGEVTSDAIF